MSVCTRFAPSPTGYLHIGNVRTALFNYLFAKHHNGKFILRIEDTDIERSKTEYAEGVMADLKSLGLVWDEGPFYQMQRLSFYQEALEKLKAKDKVYYCYCTPDELAARRKEAMLMKRPPRYDGRCRTISNDEVSKKKAQGIQPTIRFKVDEKEPVLVKDLIRGDVYFKPEEMGDFVIMRTHPSKPGEFLPTFHMSVCVDDGLMGVTHVIRGEDHLSNSPRHVLLFQALGSRVPQFAHLSLIHGPGGEPLSKRLTSIRIRDFVEKSGYLSEGLLNYLALLGWSPKDNREVMPLREVIQEFDVVNCTKHPAIFNDEKLDWVNSEHLRQLGESDYHTRSIAFLKSIGGEALTILNDEPCLKRALSLVKTDLKKFSDILPRLDFLSEPNFMNMGEEEKAVLNQAGAKEVIETSARVLSELSLEGESLFEQFMASLKKSSSQKGKALFMPFRVALTGHIHGPELKGIFGVLERKAILNRLQKAQTYYSS